MARIRKFVAYRRLERPYTRVSKYRNKNFVRAKPPIKLIRFNMGDQKKEFEFSLKLNSKKDLQIRHNALESARVASNKVLETKVGKSNYYMIVKVYPHHILRENPLASGAGADRMSTGMQKAFGKPIGKAARIKAGQTIIEVKVNKTHLVIARQALKAAYSKLPCSCSIVQA
jgi:large subunit ribosomal protein L10e